MPLVELYVPAGDDPVPAGVAALLREAGRRIGRLQRSCRFPGFVPSDFATAYRALRAVAAADVAPGTLFCEWGSGFGVVTCLAALLEFEAFGIEIEGPLVDAARELAEDFGLAAEFAHGSYIPPGGLPAGGRESFAWLATDGADGYAEIGLDADDFAVIFAYPWPDEEALAGALFERHAGAGAVLVTYHESQDCRVRRKTAGRPAHRRPRR